MKLKRALPAPPGSYPIAKFLVAMFFAALAMGTMIIAANFAGRISFSNLQLALLTLTLVLDALPFCALGLFIGAHFSGGAAPGITYLVYLPMIDLGGLFIPLPAFLQKWVVVWPAFHVQQLAVAVAASPSSSSCRHRWPVRYWWASSCCSVAWRFVGWRARANLGSRIRN